MWLAVLPVAAGTPGQMKEQREKTGKTSGISLWKYFGKKPHAYMYAYFADESEGLRFCYSYDGLKWRPLGTADGSGVFLKPQAGESKLMRDPSICQGPDGTFHMVWTCGWTESGIGYASSEDLVNWSEQRTLPVMDSEPTARNCWAPEIFCDGRQFYIVWASTIPDRFAEWGSCEDGYNHRLFYTTTRDFETFSPTEVFYDPGFSVIDGFVLKQSGTYYLFMKNETLSPEEKNIRVAAGRHLKHLPDEVSEPISGKDWAEGPAALKVGKYTYLYWDKYKNGRVGALRTRNLKKGPWEDVSGMTTFPAGLRHGTPFPVPMDLLRDLLKQAEE